MKTRYALAIALAASIATALAACGGATSVADDGGTTPADASTDATSATDAPDTAPPPVDASPVDGSPEGGDASTCVQAPTVGYRGQDQRAATKSTAAACPRSCATLRRAPGSCCSWGSLPDRAVRLEHVPGHAVLPSAGLRRRRRRHLIRVHGLPQGVRATVDLRVRPGERAGALRGVSRQVRRAERSPLPDLRRSVGARGPTALAGRQARGAHPSEPSRRVHKVSRAFCRA